MFIFKRRYRCVLCNKYCDVAHTNHIHKGIGICNDCLREIRTGPDKSFPSKAPVDYVLAPFYYESKMRKAVKQYKFSEQKAYGKVFGEMLSRELAKHRMLADFDCVVPVPLHGNRLSERGYNQSEILSEILAESLGLPCETDILFRIRETKRQSELKGAERVENVKAAFFAVQKAVYRKKIILVDDIFTMGETMSACAKALKDAGADKIIGVALCKPQYKERPIIYR